MTSSRKTCQKAQPSVEENGLLNGYNDGEIERIRANPRTTADLTDVLLPTC